MKKGVVVFMSLALLLAFCIPVVAQPSTRSVETFVIDDFDNKDNMEWVWKVQASRFIDKEDGFPKLGYFEGIPNSLRVLKKDTDKPQVLGVKTRFNRKGENWFEIYPTKDNKPYEVELKGNVTQFDFWIWGANYLYYIDLLVRDADGRVYTLPAGNVAFEGWRNIIVDVPTYIRQHSRLRSGPANMTFVGFRMRTDPDEYVDDFNVFFDQLRYTSNTLSAVYDGYELKNIDFNTAAGGSGTTGTNAGTNEAGK
jgi:hypothetical protein